METSAYCRTGNLAQKELSGLTLYRAKETIRATVVGAGTHATDVSGSTIRYDKSYLPIKNIPVLKVSACGRGRS